MKVSANFQLKEFVDPATYTARGEKSIELIDLRIITLAQFCRDFFKTGIIINNWHMGGQYKESGLRSFETATGARFSQHKYGRAVDLRFHDLKCEDVRNVIRQNWPLFKAAGLTTIEKGTPTWVHADVRFTGLETLFEVPYK